MSEETFLIRITGKGLTFKRRVPGWVAADVVIAVSRGASICSCRDDAGPNPWCRLHGWNNRRIGP